MPIYEFRCQSCSRVFERLCKVGVDPSTLSCPDCQGPVARKFSVFGVSAGRNGGAEPVASGGGGCGSCSSHNCGSCGM